MKKLFYMFLIFPLVTLGQTDTINYVKTLSYRQETATSNPGLGQANITYYDGLGRPIQQIAGKASPSRKDIVTHIEYDNYGRQADQYLPYPVQTATSLYQPEAKTATGTYYNSPKYESTTNPYSEQFFEASPLNRVLKQAAPGELWKGVGTAVNMADHSVKYSYQANKGLEVLRFKIIFPDPSDTEKPSLICKKYYAANQLYKTITKDENWTTSDGKSKTTEEFTDRLGRVILKRNYTKNQANQDEKHDTYYVYDDYGNLTYVIPPLASHQIIEEGIQLYHGSINNPWIKLIKADQLTFDDYQTAIQGYPNSEILNLDLLSQYGGKGGFGLSTDATGNLVVSINTTTSVPMEYNTGIIACLDDLGSFEDKEVGRIQGTGYDYTFLIRNNSVVVDGQGFVPSLVKTLYSAEKLDYFKNYPWIDICQADQGVASRYRKDIELLDNDDILTVYTPNDYGATGGLSISLSDDDNLTLAVNIASDVDMSLINGAAFTIDAQRAFPDAVLGSVSGSGYSYEFEVKTNVLYIRGSGAFKNLNFQGSIAFIPNYSIKEGIDGLCYIYHYDTYDRIVEKHVPDNGWTHLVYDKQFRVRLTQDENQRNENKWSFIKYNYKNEVVYTGLHSTMKDRYALKISITDGLMNEDMSSSFTNGGITINYTNNRFPTTGDILTVNYYDDYSAFASDNMAPAMNTSLGSTISPTANGLPTGSKVRVVGTNSWITTVTGYDNKFRPVWIKTKNPYLGSEDLMEQLPNFTGEISRSVRKHQKTGNPDILVYDAYYYDHTGRLLEHQQGPNPIWGWDIGLSNLIAKNTYDEIGQLTQKKVGNTTTSPLQTIDYKYNIRGWLKEINNPNYIGNDLFGFAIDYSGLYNGNISKISWASSANEAVKKYTYSYDALNRLTDAIYSNPVNTTEKYNENGIVYDKNGNILALSRSGNISGSNFGTIDNLSYSYKPMSNQLMKVADTSIIKGFTDGINADYDYDYDNSGNMVKDLNKGIGSSASQEIKYNHLNLPTDVIQAVNNKIKYIYDASGQKVEKRVTHALMNETVTQYDNGFVYQDNILQYYPHPEGYVRRETNGNFTYIYQYKDHLGNVRLSYADTNGDGVIYDAQKFSDGFEGENNWNATWNGYGSYLNPLVIDYQKTPHSGNSCAKLTSPGPGEAYSHSAISLEVNNTEPTQYIYSGWYYSDGPAVEMYLFMNKVDETFYYTDLNRIIATTVGTGKWEYIEKIVLVQPNIKKINLRLDVNSTGSVWFDDVSIRRANGTTEVIAENNYYPFGMTHEGPNNVAFSSDLGQKIKYQGQELQNELGLGWYAFKWRNYNPEIARFMSIDPLTEEYEDYTPYQFASNQPVHAQEVEGLENSHDLNKRLTESSPTQNDAISRARPNIIPLKSSQSSSNSSFANIKIIDGPTMYASYPGESLDIAITEGIQWLGGLLSSSDVSQETSENVQLATTLLVVVASKGKNAKADAEVIEQLTKAETRAAKLSQTPRPGKPVTKAGKEAVIDVNKAKNSGKTVCETCATNTVPAQQSKRGVTPPKNETNVDHVIPKSKGGSGTPDNGQVLCRDCNTKKGNN